MRSIRDDCKGRIVACVQGPSAKALQGFSMIEEKSPESETVERTVTHGSDPNHRLILRFVSVLNGAGWDFYELDWQQKIGSEWRRHHSISAEEFQVGSSLRRWVCEISSFNPTNASAIVQIGSMDSDDPRYHEARYAWGLLHLYTLDLQILQVCADPFEPYLGETEEGD
jgi:hypothetical protein